MAQVERIRTLLVEDDVPMRALLRRALEATGEFEVIAEAGDGVAAIDRATLLQPELILLDLMMPIMNGFQALPLLLKASPVSRIVVLSMLQGNPIEKECLQLGASAFVDKMVKDEDLIRQILAAMDPNVCPNPRPLRLGSTEREPESLITTRLDGRFVRHRTLPSDAPRRREILAAERTLRPYASATPLIASATGAGNRFLKLETLSPTGSFKWRGVLNRMLTLPRSTLRRGVVTASTGNHGFAVGWAAARLDAPATVVVPRGTPIFKQARIKTTGAKVLIRGATWNDSLLIARDLAEKDGSTTIEDGEDPVLMAGTATVGREIVHQLPDADVIVAPVGGGNLIAAIACALEAEGSDAKLVGVQSSTARGAYDSWRANKVLARPVRTLAGGIATAGPVPFAFEIMRRRVDRMHLVSDDDMLRAVGTLAQVDGVVAEPSGAASLALLGRLRVPARKKVVLVVTGRSMEPSMLREALRRPLMR